MDLSPINYLPRQSKDSLYNTFCHLCWATESKKGTFINTMVGIADPTQYSSGVYRVDRHVMDILAVDIWRLVWNSLALYR